MPWFKNVMRVDSVYLQCYTAPLESVMKRKYTLSGNKNKVHLEVYIQNIRLNINLCHPCGVIVYVWSLEQHSLLDMEHDTFTWALYFNFCIAIKAKCGGIDGIHRIVLFAEYS